MLLRFSLAIGFGPADVLPHLGWLFFLIIAIGIAAALLTAKLKADKTTGVPPKAMCQRKPLLSNAEMSFLAVLEKAASPQLRIYTQVPLCALVEITQISERTFHKLAHKIVDFVLVDPQTMVVRKVVELDDRSHDQADRQNRDELVDDVLGRAGIPVKHIKAQAAYDPAKLRELLG